MAKMFVSHDSIGISAWTEPGQVFVVASRNTKKSLDFIFAAYLQPRGAVEPYLRDLLSLVSDLRPMPVREIRNQLAPDKRQCLTSHVLEIHRKFHEPLQSVIADVAWRYEELTSWGETAAAKVLSEELQIPQRTIHTRLRLARDRGLIESPGAGARMGHYE
jgi:hypothetical protein